MSRAQWLTTRMAGFMVAFLPALLLTFELPAQTPQGKTRDPAGTAGQASSGTHPVSESSDTTAVVTTPIILLLRDETVRTELGLNPPQTKSVDEEIARLDYPLWMVRDSKDPEVGKQAGAAIEQLQDKLATIFQPAQKKRFDEIMLRVQGWPAVLAPRTADKLKITADERGRIEAIMKRAKEEAAKSGSPNDAAMQKQIQEVLTSAQQHELGQLVGKPFDVAKVRGRPCHAPPIDGVDEWINSQPLAWSGLEGKVVAVHFWTFGCSNCIHNLPHYKAWHEKFADRGLVILGFHTPETAGERVLESVRRKVQEYEIKYPAAVDGSSKNWNAYNNRWWPSVYLVDKRGFIRYWWYGELNWQGTKGEEYIRGRIEELLAEKG